MLLPLICRPERLQDVRVRLASKLRAFAIDAIVLDVAKFQSIIGTARPYHELHGTVLSQIDLLSVSPYQIVDPARRTFAGR